MLLQNLKDHLTDRTKITLLEIQELQKFQENHILKCIHQQSCVFHTGKHNFENCGYESFYHYKKCKYTFDQFYIEPEI